MNRTKGIIKLIDFNKILPHALLESKVKIEENFAIEEPTDGAKELVRDVFELEINLI